MTLDFTDDLLQPMVTNNIHIIILAMGLAALLSCQLQSPPDSPTLASDEDKFYPSDHLYFQRAYPQQSIDLRELSAELVAWHKKEKKNSHKRSGSWINQGPGNAGARINIIALHPASPLVIYVGYSGGGAYKTEDGGTTWLPIFDDFPFLAVGAIAIDPNDPDHIYLGTGDPNISGNPFIGNGLFESLDGGQTWKNIGLEQTGIISKIIVDPTNSQNIYVSTMGTPYFRDEHRGVYRSKNGGQTWSQALFLGDGTGVIDLVMAPNNPQVLLAAGWNRIRNYEESTTFGDGARIHKSMDGGETWEMLTDGLPLDIHSRIGLTMTAANPDRVYAIYVDTTHEVGGVYTSVDQGDNWNEMDTGSESGLPANTLGGFGWYFGKIRANPTDEQDLFLLGVRLWRYDANTKKWSRFDRSSTDPVHADKHDLVFRDTNTILLATDGGLYRSPDNGLDWIDIEDIPAT